MYQLDLALGKYWVTQSVYFRFENTVELGMGIADANILFYHSISYQSREKKNSVREYNKSAVYDRFNIHFPVDCGSTYLNLHPMTIGDSSITNKRARYNPDTIAASIYVAYVKHVSTFNKTSDP